MLLFITFLTATFLASFWTGFQRFLQLRHLNRRILLNGLLALMIVFTMLAAAQWLDMISRQFIARFTELLYIIVSGFFFGYGFKMIRLRNKIGSIEYVHRSFWTDIAPNILAMLLITFGIYRTGLFGWGPFTEIGITSGLSLLGFGFFGFTIRIVPEFRKKGILILDQQVPWRKVIAYRWKSESILKIDYYANENELTTFSTYIPAEDELRIERLLGRKLKEFEEARKEQLNQSAEEAQPQ